MIPNKPNKIILHHDGVTRTGDSFDIINQYHKDKFGVISKLGFYVGYHYFIESTGAIRQAREDDEEGVHCIGENFTSVGIGLADNFDVHLPTMAQVESLGIVMAEVISTWNIDPTHIFPHRKYSQKTCPGTRLPDDFGFLVYDYHRAKMKLHTSLK